MTDKQRLAMHQARLCARTLRSKIKKAQGDPDFMKHKRVWDSQLGLWVEATTAAIEKLGRELAT